MGTRRCLILVSLAVAFCFVLSSLAQAQVTESWMKANVKNVLVAAKIPIWQLTNEGVEPNCITWKNATNKRFAVYDPGTPADETDDLVLDKETSLVWARDAGGEGSTYWWNSINAAANFEDGNRAGWRLPTRDELLSLVDPGNAGGGRETLPTDHPFLNVQYGGEPQQEANYWTQTTCENNSDYAWIVDFESGDPTCGSRAIKSEGDHYIWPVRGGNGYATGNW